MITARRLREPSPATAVAVRLTAFVVTLASAIIVPATVIATAIGHERLPAAIATIGFAVTLSLVATIAARRVDPLRR